MLCGNEVGACQIRRPAPPTPGADQGTAVEKTNSVRFIENAQGAHHEYPKATKVLRDCTSGPRDIP